MAYKKFDKHQNGKYWENYFNKGIDFYRLIQDHMQESLGGRSTKGLDVGAGPGVGARLAADAGLETLIIGYEPSDTHKDGEKLAEELKADESPTVYLPRTGGIEAISGIEENSLDYIVILRACHEIADSVGGKEVFMQYLSRLIPLLKPEGKIIVGEPQFSPEITENPENYQDLIKEVQNYQEKAIGHSHVPSDYITFSELENEFERAGLILERRDFLEHKPVLNHLREQGYTLEKSPNMFYVETFSKK